MASADILYRLLKCELLYVTAPFVFSFFVLDEVINYLICIISKSARHFIQLKTLGRIKMFSYFRIVFVDLCVFMRLVYDFPILGRCMPLL